jgi:type I restriction enzyme S subunit
MKYPAYKKTHKTGLPWVPVVPAHWETKRLRFLAEGIEQGWSPQCNNYPAEGDEWGVLKVGCVNGNAFNPRENKQLPADLEPRLEYQIKLGDILISRANTRELLGSAGIVNQLTTRLLLCDKLYRLRVDNTVDKHFLVYYLRSKAARAHYECEATGTSGSMQNIGQDTIANLPVPLPPLNEQRVIVEFLNEQTARLDALLNQQHNLLNLLSEKRTALINQAVTQGLDMAVSCRPSSVEWLHKVPAHWKERRLKFLATCNDDVLNEDTNPLQEIEYIDISSVNLVEGVVATDKFIFDVAPSRARRRVQHGDTIVSTVRTYLKAVATIRNPSENLIVSTGFAVIRPGIELDPEFLGYFCKSEFFVSKVVAVSTGVSYPATNASDIMDLSIMYPPLEEQRNIVKFLDKQTTNLDALLDRQSRIIIKLQEYRAALITNAVTGQIDVRAAVTAEAA